MYFQNKLPPEMGHQGFSSGPGLMSTYHMWTPHFTPPHPHSSHQCHWWTLDTIITQIIRTLLTLLIMAQIDSVMGHQEQSGQELNMDN